MLRQWSGFLAALAAAAVWIFLAQGSPTSTFHFAPLVVAGAWVIFDGISEAGLTQRVILRRAGLGFVIAGLATLLLNGQGNLQGPVFWDSSADAPVVFEHLVFAGLGSAIGAAVALRRASRG